jgi:hypothetical protein
VRSYEWRYRHSGARNQAFPRGLAGHRDTIARALIAPARIEPNLPKPAIKSSAERLSIVATKYLIAGIALATLVFAAPLPHTAEAANCKTFYVTAEGKSYSQTSAKKKAWQNWQNKVWAQYGLNWSVPEYAASKSTTCTGKYKCVAKGKPCFHMPQ